MTVIYKDIDYYVIRYRNKGDQFANALAYIECWYHQSQVGVIRFWADTDPHDSYTQSNMINLNFGISRFNDVVSLLRYEKPLLLVFDSTSKIGGIDTKTVEPIGEQEGV